MKRSLARDAFGAMSVVGVVGIAIAVYVMSAILPGAISDFFNASTVGWSSGAASLWDLIPLIIIVALLFAFLPRGDSSGG